MVRHQVRRKMQLSLVQLLYLSNCIVIVLSELHCLHDWLKLKATLNALKGYKKKMALGQRVALQIVFNCTVVSVSQISVLFVTVVIHRT